MDDAGNLTALIRRFQEGDAEAARLLVGHYAQALLRVAERHLDRRLARRVEGEDLVQSVFRTVFRRGKEGALPVHDRAHFWHLLLKITLAKAHAEYRHHTAGLRDVRAEAPGADAWLAGACATAPGPEEAAALLDVIEVTLDGLEPLHAQVFEGLLQGHSVAEISQQVGKTRQAVDRIRHLIRQRLVTVLDKG